ncbi:MAG: glycosyltransferase family 4 protein [Anaerolineae bacterium]|nr:glycosyltransferase family 4 protein [Anaerolineae bacterium]
MKILSILSYYYPHWTGLTAYAQRLAEGLAERGHEVTVLTSRHNPTLPREEVYNGVRVVRLPVLFRLSRGPVQPTFPFAAYRLIREHDVVQIHTVLMESLLVTILARLAGRKVLFTHHGDLVMPTGFLNRVIERSVTWMMTQAEKASARISIHSEDYARHSGFLSPFLAKMAFIYPPIIIPEPDQQAVAAWRSKLGLDSNPLVGFAGRFVEEKGFDYLFKAIPHILESRPNARFVYAGEFPVYENFYGQCEQLLDGCSDHVTFLGLIRDRQKLADFYRMCDVFVLPSRSDCFPSTQIEAMFCGTPVVCTDIPGAREAVKATGMGIIVPPRDERALAEGVVHMLDSAASYCKTREEVASVFDLERTVDQYEALLAELADVSPGTMGEVKA